MTHVSVLESREKGQQLLSLDRCIQGAGLQLETGNPGYATVKERRHQKM